MLFTLLLKPECYNCGSKDDLFGSNCKHMTLCSTCGKSMAEKHGTCFMCGAFLTRLIREYNVRVSKSSDKNYFIGKFASGLPSFSKNCAENRWSLHKKGINGDQITDFSMENFQNKVWLLEDETGQSQYHGHLECGQSAIYYLLMLQGKEFIAIAAGSRYNFNNASQYRQLTIEDEEEKMKKWRNTVDGYGIWMMKALTTGRLTPFGHCPEVIRGSPLAAGGKRCKKSDGGYDSNLIYMGEEHEGEDSEEPARKARFGMNKKGGDDNNYEGRRGGDFDNDDHIEKGDDWEHEKIFTDADTSKLSSGADSKKLKTESGAETKKGKSSAQEPISEEEIKAFMLQRAARINYSETLSTFRARLKSPEGCETMEQEQTRQQFPFYNEMSSDDEDEHDSEENKRTKTKARKDKSNILASGSNSNNVVSSSINVMKEMLEDFMKKQLQMEVQWREAYEAREEERRRVETEWRRRMEELENERLMIERRWREREEQTRLREELGLKREMFLLMLSWTCLEEKTLCKIFLACKVR